MPMSKRQFSIFSVSFAFFAWGFLTCLNDILIPHLKDLFDLNFAKAMLVQMAFFMTYALLSVPMASILSKLGYQRSIVLGFIIVGIGCLGFLPAASKNVYGLFLISLIVLAAGVVLLQVAANPYASLLGDPKTASSRLTFMQALNSLGTTVAPFFGGALILHEVSKHATHQEIAHLVQFPYLLLAIIVLVIGFIFSFLKLEHIPIQDNASQTKLSGWQAYERLLEHKHLMLGCIAIFAYVGAEVAIGSFLVNYSELPEIGGLSATKAASVVALYWGGAMTGRFIGSYCLSKLSPPKVAAFNAVIAIALVTTSIFTQHYIAIASIVAVGLFNSILFPTLFSLAVRELGPLTPQGSGLLCLSICGGAVIPWIQGHLADQIGIQHAFVIPIFCYLYILYYCLSGYDKRISLGEVTLSASSH